MYSQVKIKLFFLKVINLSIKAKLNNSKISYTLILLYFLFINSSYSQIGTVEKIQLDNNIEFQEYFFEALTQKAIRNHENAIAKLEKCNQLIPNNKAVLFELSKNYLETNKLPESLIFGKQALIQENNNIWILEHLVKVYKMQHDYFNAIQIQSQIVQLNQNKKSKLVYLHLLNKDVESAKKVINELENAKMLTSSLRNIKKRLEIKSNSKENVQIKNDLKKLDIETIFNKNKTFENYKNLVKKLSINKNKKLLKYTEKGLTLFPAQPFSYLINAKALIHQKKYKKSIESLKNGLNFIIDDKKTEKEFYKLFVISYKCLGDNKNMKKYQKKL